jgi:hypothetical protein
MSGIIVSVDASGASARRGEAVSKRVLVVEDDAQNSYLIGFILASRGGEGGA